MLTQLYLLKTLSGLHCGVGRGINDIDLPTSRDPITDHPNAPGSSFKGVLRDHCWGKTGTADHPDRTKVEAIFGPDPKTVFENPDRPIDFASCVSFGDAQLLCLPMRSHGGTFAYLTSPIALLLFKAVLERTGYPRAELDKLPIHNLSGAEGADLEIALPTSTPSQLSIPGTDKRSRVLLEDIDLTATDNPAFVAAADRWLTFLIGLLNGNRTFDPALFAPRFAIVCDLVFDHLCETALPVVTRNAVGDNGVVDPGALWTEEFIPAEAILYGLLHAEPSRRHGLGAQAALNYLISNTPAAIQLGGKATTGRGLVSLQFASSQPVKS